MAHTLIVALGGALGASCRHLTGLAALRLLGPGFPWGTLAVNIIGSFAMGVLIALLGRRLDVSNDVRLFLATGFLGGFTTFSAFSLEVVMLWERGDLAGTAFYVIASVVFAVLALLAGLSLVRALA